MKNQKAITLISLVITIIILIILAGIGVNLSLGENGIYRRVREAKDKYLTAQKNEEKELSETENHIEEYLNYKQIAGGLMFIDVDNLIEKGDGVNYTYTAKEDSVAFILANGSNKGFQGFLNNIEVFRFQSGTTADDHSSDIIPIKKGQTLSFATYGHGSGDILVKIYKILN